jgi:phenol 2-monooxygenase
MTSSHVHSVMGAFGLNASIMDASNLAWKMGLVAQNKAKLEPLMSTYNLERREHACRIIETSGEYLRFVCAVHLDIAKVRGLGEGSNEAYERPGEGVQTKSFAKSATNGTQNGTLNAKLSLSESQREKDLEFLRGFFGRNGQFLLGVDAPFESSVITPPQLSIQDSKQQPPLQVNHGVRAPNPRVCF